MEILEALAWLDSHLDHEAGTAGIAAGEVEGLSLASMEELVALLGDPQHDVPVIHITGTNGKGSVAAMITALLGVHGLTVGTFTSPHLDRINERICRDGEPISDVDLAEVLSGLASVEELLPVRPTWFELVTAAAFRWFAEAPVDVAVVEVGLLGRYDATNVVDGRVTVVTGVGGDHTNFAPGWEQSVATEKAGIIRPDAIAVLGPMAPELREVFESEGPQELWCHGDGFEVDRQSVAVGGRVIDVRGALGRYDDVFIPLHGAQQGENAAVSIAAVEAFFGRELDHELVQEGFATLRLQARFEVVSHAPLVILDVAHNPDAIRRAAQTLDEEFTVIGSRTVVIGMLAGRDPDATAAVLADARPDLVVCTSLGDEGRSLDGRVLAAAMQRRGLATEVVPDAAEAVARVLQRAEDEDLVLILGSFRLMTPARLAIAASSL